MDKEQQDLAWKCLPKEVREEIKEIYQAKIYSTHDTEAYQKDILDEIFGHHNLTSDTEPEELLFVEREKVQAEYKKYDNIREYNSNRKTEEWEIYLRRGRRYGGCSVLNTLFGDKCLPDKELNEDNFAKPEPSVQVEPNLKFKYDIDDKVLLKGSDKPMLIRQRVGFKDYDNGYQITTLDTRYPQWVKESDLEPYTEPETKEMEEKELNLCELLKGCEEVYSLLEGITYIRKVDDSLIETVYEKYGEKGEVFVNGVCCLYPSRALYEKYPLDAYSAWMEWKESRKLKRWRASKDEYFYLITAGGEIGSIKDAYSDYCNDLYEFGNYFRTKEEAQQAAEAVEECLKKFYENNTINN